jgi:hypothetical protein
MGKKTPEPIPREPDDDRYPGLSDADRKKFEAAEGDPLDEFPHRPGDDA